MATLTEADLASALAAGMTLAIIRIVKTWPEAMRDLERLRKERARRRT